MKANELRIGNFIYDNEGLISKVIGLSPFDYSVRCDEPEGCDILLDIYIDFNKGQILKDYTVESNICNSIPLTEEWLIRFGFVKRGNEQEFGMNKYFVCKRFGKYEMCQGIEYNSFTKPFEFVHSLQNLYFALTGEELTLKK